MLGPELVPKAEREVINADIAKNDKDIEKLEVEIDRLAEANAKLVKKKYVGGIPEFGASTSEDKKGLQKEEE